jgi:phosphoribosylglycinamide formyltransferase
MTEQPKTRLTVLISGNGSNLQALIDATKPTHPLSSCAIVRVISNRKAAYGLTRAQEASIPTKYHNLLEYKKRYPDDVGRARSEYDAELASLILADAPQLVVCAGFMHILTPSFLDPLSKAGVPVINLHPSLPGQFKGANGIGDAHKAWMDGEVEKTGVMIHDVVVEVDEGPALLVEEIPFIKGVDEDIGVFEQRVHEVEWKAIVQGTLLAVKRLGC